MGTLQIQRTHSYVCAPTFRNIHWIHAAQHVSDIKALSLHFTQPVVTSKVESEVRSDHICHHHSVQEPAGVHPRVIVLNSRATKQQRADYQVFALLGKQSSQSLNAQLIIAQQWLNQKCGSKTKSQTNLIFFKGPTLWVLILNTSVLALSNAVRLLKS